MLQFSIYSSVLIYLLPYLFLLFGSYALRKFSDNLYRLYFIAIIILASSLAIFRGDVGVDTGTYERVIEYYLFDDIKLNMEIGFLYLVKVLSALDNEPRIIVRLITFLICLLFSVFFCTSRVKMFIFSILVFPLFFYDFTMNGLRYGLAFLLVLLSASYSNKGKVKIAFLLGMLSVSFHLSSVVLFFLLNVKKFRTFEMVALPAIALILFYIFSDYLFVKFWDYQLKESPNWYSGILKTLSCSILIYFLKKKDIVNNREFLSIVIFTGIAALVTQFSYAGLRLLGISIFYSVAKIAIEYRRDSVNFKGPSSGDWVLTLVGILEFSNFIRIAVSLAYSNDTPFIPYEVLS